MTNEQEITGSPLPSLPPDLRLLFNSLDNDHKRLFIKVFRWLFHYVNSRCGSVVFLFWAGDMFRRRLELTSSDLAVLTYLYYISGRGVFAVRSEAAYNSGILPGLLPVAYKEVIYRLKKRGYLTRSTSDPSRPYLSRSRARQPVFISLTSSGCNVIRGIDKDMNRFLLNTSIDDLTGVSKKPYMTKSLVY